MLSELNKMQLRELRKEIENYKSDFRETINVPGDIQFGCEVEFNTKENPRFYRSYVDPIYKTKKDYSALDIVEIVSPIMHNTKEDWESMRNLLVDIKSGSDAVISATSGGHIHYDHTILKDSNVLTMLKFWEFMEDTIYDFASGDFDELRPTYYVYARKLPNLRSVITDIENGDSSLKILQKYDKLCGLNLYNHFHGLKLLKKDKDTFEVRVPNGSLNIDTWQNNVEFFANMFYYTNDVNNKNTIDELYKNDYYYGQFGKRLLAADLLYKDEESKIRFLNQFEKEGEFKKSSIALR